MQVNFTIKLYQSKMDTLYLVSYFMQNIVFSSNTIRCLNLNYFFCFGHSEEFNNNHDGLLHHTFESRILMGQRPHEKILA